MQISKWTILLYLFVTEAILVLMHLVLYWAALAYFPFLMPYKFAIMGVLLALAFSFNISWALDLKSQNEFFRWFHIIAACWMPLWSYFLMAFAAASAVLLFFPLLPLTPLAGIFLLAAFLLNIYGIINARTIRTVNIALKLKNLPSFWQGKTACLVTDIHLGHILRQDFARKVVKKINNLKPDIIFIAGDFFDGIHADFRNLAEPFKNLQAPQGIFFCSGNHELYAGMKECEDSLRDAGITILENEKADIQGLQIAGTAYQTEETPERLKAIFSKIYIDKNKPSILLKHVPTLIPTAADAGFNAQLSGHSHQGQVWPFRYITSRIFRGFDYGLKKFGKMSVYTSSGVGTWGPPVRIFTKSEIVSIKFKKD